MKDYDILVVGGGINGAGIARDAAGRGYSVCLAEMNDLASGTSSWSSKLIHGGLRYLEHYEFRLVRQALGEREVLLRAAPHVIRPMRFVLPLRKGLRSGFLLRMGLFLYDNLGARKLLPGTRDLDLRQDPAGEPLRDEYTKGYEYSDCHTSDTRLVVLNAMDARARGADVAVRTQVTEARREGGGWHVTMEDLQTGRTSQARARLLVNAGGPWVDRILQNVTRRNDARNVRLVQGSHIITRKLYEHDRAYIVQTDDGRIIFFIPYEDEFTLIGTTDHDFEGDPGEARITDEEVDYLIEVSNRYLKRPIERDDIVWTYSGVRPLYDDGASAAKDATRDYVLELEGDDAPILNIFGGKLTTYRKLSEAAMRKVEDALGAKGDAWTAEASLPGGDFPAETFDVELARFATDYPFLTRRTARRLFTAYGTRARTILDGARRTEDLGEHYGADLYEREVAYLIEHEFATTAEDIVWRRSKLALVMSADERAALAERVGTGGTAAFRKAAE